MKLHNIFFKSLYDHRLATFFWFLGVFLMMVMYITMYPSIAGSSEIGEAMAQLPEAFQSIFGDLSIITMPEGYLEAELFSLTLPLIIVIASVVLSGAVIYKEETSGSIELLLSRPISRTSFLVQKIAALLLHTSVIAIAAILGLLVGQLFVEFPISLANYSVAVLQSLLLGLIFGLLSLAVTAAKPSRGLSVGLPTVLFVLGFVVNGFAASVEFFDAIKAFTPFHYYQSLTVLLDGPIWSDVAVLTSINVVLLGITLVAFSRRDVGV